MIRTILLALVLSLLGLVTPPSPAEAADDQGRFAVKGVGTLACSRFTAAREARDNLYFVFGGWIDGYLTAHNQHVPNTFDAVAWETTDLLAVYLDVHCRKHPDEAFYLAVAKMTAALADSRVTAETPLVEARVGEAAIKVYGEVLKRAQRALATRGYYGGAVDGRWGPASQAAFEAFQRDEKLTVTGLPDQPTLAKLFRG